MASILGSLVHKCRKSKYFISSYQHGPKHLFWTRLIQYHNKISIKILSAVFSGMTHVRLPFEQHSIILCLTTIHSFLSLIGHFVVGETFSADKVNQLHGEKKKNPVSATVSAVTFTIYRRGKKNNHAVTVKRLLRLLMAHFLHSTSVSHNARHKFPSLGLITLRDLSATEFHGHVRDIFPYPPLRLQRLGCVSMTFTKGRSECFNMKGGEKKSSPGFFFFFLNSQLGLFCKRSFSHAGCATQSALS